MKIILFDKITKISVRIMTLWLCGGFIYYIIELIYRGHSHPAMFIVGGICFLILGVINNKLSWDLNFILQCVIGGVSITIVEFIAGLILNVWLGWGIWDYTNVPLNVLGQICLPYTLIWIGLSAVGIWLDDFLRWTLCNEDKPRYSFNRRKKA